MYTPDYMTADYLLSKSIQVFFVSEVKFIFMIFFCVFSFFRRSLLLRTSLVNSMCIVSMPQTHFISSALATGFEDLSSF